VRCRKGGSGSASVVINYFPPLPLQFWLFWSILCAGGSSSASVVMVGVNLFPPLPLQLLLFWSILSAGGSSSATIAMVGVNLFPPIPLQLLLFWSILSAGGSGSASVVMVGVNLFPPLPLQLLLFWSILSAGGGLSWDRVLLRFIFTETSASLQRGRAFWGQAEASTIDWVPTLHVGCSRHGSWGCPRDECYLETPEPTRGADRLDGAIQPGFVSPCCVGGDHPNPLVIGGEKLALLGDPPSSRECPQEDLGPSLAKLEVSFWTGYTSSRSLHAPGVAGLDVEATR